MLITFDIESLLSSQQIDSISGMDMFDVDYAMMALLAQSAGKFRLD